jgi:hypothetical protein
MMGELKYFLGFQIKQLQEGTFICQIKYIQDILKKFGMKNATHQDSHGNKWASRPRHRRKICRSKGIPVDDRIFTLFMCFMTGYYAFRLHVCKVPGKS